MKLSILPLRRSFSLPRYRLQSAPLAFLLLLLLWCKPDTRAQTFVPSTVPESVFPLPINPGKSSFYPVSRFLGSAYRSRIGPIAGATKHLLLWGIDFWDVTGIQYGIAFKITNSLTDTSTYMRGFIRANAAPAATQEMQLSFVGNRYAAYVLAAYWNVTIHSYVVDAYKLNTNLTSPTSGLTFLSSTMLYTPMSPAMMGARISMFGYDLLNTGVVWEEPGVGVFAKGIRLDSTNLIFGNTFQLPGTNGCRFPDITANPAPITSGSDGLAYHFAFVDTAALVIKEAVMGVYDLLNFGAATPIVPSAPLPYKVEDTLVISKYDPAWDGFQLHIATPVFSSASTGWYATGNWAYTFYNNDTNKIYVRAQSAAHAPVTYVVNDGSLGNGNITRAGNAFPAITYTGHDKLLVGWYTTYDPGLPAGTNPLYTYSANSKKYIALEMSDNGTGLSDYLEVSNNYTNNTIGEGISWSAPFYSGHPYIAFSKRTLDAVFVSYACYGPTDIWHDFRDYYTYPRDGAFSPVFSDDANYIATKLIIPVTPVVFRQAQPVETPISVMGNPFTDNRIFQLQGDNSIQYELDMTAMDGRRVYTASGLIPDLNSTLRFAGPINSLQPGVYILHLNAKGVAAQTFKLVKQ
jgi:hypothetical protein